MTQIKNLGELLAEHRNSNRTVIIDLRDPASPREVDYPTFDAACNAVARAMTKAGLSIGHRFGLILSNRLEFLEIFFGAMRAGIVPVPINVQLPKTTVEWTIQDSKIDLVFCDQEHVSLCPDNVRIIKIDDPGQSGYEAFKDYGEFEAITPADDAVAFQPYTSGSTGRPKGVLLSHKAHVWVSQTIARDRKISPNDRMIVAAPLYHKNAMNAVKSVLVAGASMILLPRFHARTYLEALRQYRATTLSGVPTIYALLLKERDLIEQADLSAVRLLTLGGAPASDALIDALAEKFTNAEIIQIFENHRDERSTFRTASGWQEASTPFGGMANSGQ